MTELRQHLRGERPTAAVATVLGVGVAAAAVLAPFGILAVGVAGRLGTGAFLLAFGVIPGAAGWICGRYRLGAPAAVASGVATGVAFFLLVAVGSALGTGSFGGGDSPLGRFALALTVPGLAAATSGFVLGVGWSLAARGDRSR